jgi:hypothetical protein
MYPHRIRLRGPWECEAVSSDCEKEVAAARAARRVNLPCRWEDLGDPAGRVRFRRRFGYPGRIDDYERVWLIFEGLCGVKEIRLNGHSLLEREPAQSEFAITELLKERNELVVDVEAGSAVDASLFEAALEIRCAAFLRGVKAWLERTGEKCVLHVTGAVAGTSERPLELYALLDRRNAAYSTAMPDPAGRPFHLVSEALQLQSGEHQVRVDLVNGGVVWYALEQSLEV